MNPLNDLNLGNSDYEHRHITSHSINPPSHNFFNNKSRIEDQELFIGGFMKLTINDDLQMIALAILRGIDPLINKNDIISVRLVHTRGDNTNQASKFPSIIPRLTSSRMVQQIMLSKRSKNYFSTNDIDHSILSNTDFPNLPPTKIIINSVLSSIEYKQFSSLKTVARSLGFKFVWHKEGKFLVKRRSGDRAHYFSSVTELRAIWACYSDNDSTNFRHVENNNLQNVDTHKIDTGSN